MLARSASTITVTMFLMQAALVFGNNAELTLNVAAVLAPPFIIAQIDEVGNETYVGFIPDVLKRLSMREDLRFKYANLADDNTERVNSSWGGVLQAIAHNKAQLGTGPIPKKSREHPSGIHYTVKIADHAGWTVLMRKPPLDKSSIFEDAMAVLRPFSTEVWLAVIASFVAVSVLLALINLVNPYEWRRLYQRDKVAKTDANQLSPLGTLFFVFSTFVWQGYEKSPRSASARVLVMIWVTFVAVTLISYTANLTNYLNHRAHRSASLPLNMPIDRPLDLLKKTSIRVGTIETWPILEQLEMHENKAVRALAGILKKRGDNVATLQQGLSKVYKSADYALILDKVVAQDIVKNHCNVITIGEIEPSDIRGYGIVTPANIHQGNGKAVSTFRKALKRMESDDTLHSLWKFWKEKEGRCGIDWESDIKKPPVPVFRALQIYQFIGPLVLLGAGVLLSVIITLAEVLTYYLLNKMKKVDITSHRMEDEHHLHIHDDIDDDLKP